MLPPDYICNTEVKAFKALAKYVPIHNSTYKYMWHQFMRRNKPIKPSRFDF